MELANALHSVAWGFRALASPNHLLPGARLEGAQRMPGTAPRGPVEEGTCPVPVLFPKEGLGRLRCM